MNSGGIIDRDNVFGKIEAHPDPNNESESESESRIFKIVLYHCFLVLGGPIIAFFVTKNILLTIILQWGPAETKTDVVSAIVAGSL